MAGKRHLQWKGGRKETLFPEAVEHDHQRPNDRGRPWTERLGCSHSAWAGCSIFAAAGVRFSGRELKTFKSLNNRIASGVFTLQGSCLVVGLGDTDFIFKCHSSALSKRDSVQSRGINAEKGKSLVKNKQRQRDTPGLKCFFVFHSFWRHEHNSERDLWFCLCFSHLLSGFGQGAKNARNYKVEKKNVCLNVTVFFKLHSCLF